MKGRLEEDNTLTRNLMEQIGEPANLNRAYNAWFEKQGLLNLQQQANLLNTFS